MLSLENRKLNTRKTPFRVLATSVLALSMAAGFGIAHADNAGLPKIANKKPLRVGFEAVRSAYYFFRRVFIAEPLFKAYCHSYGKGLHTKNGFVPEQHTDFIFTAVGEDLGFIGGATLLILYSLLAWRLWRIALLSSDFFGTLVAIGVLAMFAIQIFENVGMTMGIMPITGIPLPFMSYGGSAVIASFIAIGLVLNIHMRRFS